MKVTKAILDVSLSAYCGEPCRICGQPITRGDVAEAVFAGYSDGNKSRAAHGSCWANRPPQGEWAYPEDAAQQVRPPYEPFVLTTPP